MSDRSKSSVGDRTVRGAALMTAQTLLTKVVTTVGQLVLAAILLPEDFGLFALAVTVVGYASVIQKAGISEVLIREQGRLDRWVNAGFWMSQLLGWTSAIAMLAAAVPVSHLFGEDRIVGLIAVLAIAQPFLASTLVIEAKLERDMRYRDVALVHGGSNIAQMLLMVLCALLGLGAFSFAVPRVLIAASRLVWLWKLSAPRIRRRLQLHRWPFFLAAAGPTVGAALLEATVQQADYIVLGFVAASSATVGFYFFAFNQSTQVAQLFVQSVVRVVMSGLSTLRDNPQRQVEVYLRGAGMLAALAIPLGVLQAAAADPLLRFFFGDRWAGSIPLIQVLSIAAGVSAAGWPVVGLLMAQGRYATRFRLRLWGALVFVPLVGIGAILGVPYQQEAMGVAIAVAAYRLLIAPISTLVGSRGTQVRRVTTIFVLPVIGSLLVLGPVTPAAQWLGQLLPGRLGYVLELVVLLVLTAPGYWLWMRIAQRDTLTETLDRARRVLPSRVSKYVPSWLG
ncbi:MAG: oligosaccharide flippase family protein [Planctomycetota bacterium]